MTKTPNTTVRVYRRLSKMHLEKVHTQRLHCDSRNDAAAAGSNALHDVSTDYDYDIDRLEAEVEYDNQPWEADTWTVTPYPPNE